MYIRAVNCPPARLISSLPRRDRERKFFPPLPVESRPDKRTCVREGSLRLLSQLLKVLLIHESTPYLSRP